MTRDDAQPGTFVITQLGRVGVIARVSVNDFAIVQFGPDDQTAMFHLRTLHLATHADVAAAALEGVDGIIVEST